MREREERGDESAVKKRRDRERRRREIGVKRERRETYFRIKIMVGCLFPNKLGNTVDTLGLQLKIRFLL
jgi:hypothetical protein